MKVLIYNPLATPHERLSALLATKPRWVGSRALAILLAHPGIRYSALELSLLADGLPLPRAALLPQRELRSGLQSAASEPGWETEIWSPLPYCDRQALRDYQGRLAQLARLRELRLAQDPAADTAELDWERDFLLREIRRNTLPRGGIKRTSPERKRAYRRLRIALNRLLAWLARADPGLALWAEAKLSTDRGFAWHGIEPHPEPQPSETQTFVKAA